MPVSQTLCLIKANAEVQLPFLYSLSIASSLMQRQLNVFFKLSKISLKAWTKPKEYIFFCTYYNCPSLPSEQTVARTPCKALCSFQTDISIWEVTRHSRAFGVLMLFSAGARHAEEIRGFVMAILLPIEWKHGFFSHFFSPLFKILFNS